MAKNPTRVVRKTSIRRAKSGGAGVDVGRGCGVEKFDRRGEGMWKEIGREGIGRGNRRKSDARGRKVRGCG